MNRSVARSPRAGRIRRDPDRGQFGVQRARASALGSAVGPDRAGECLPDPALQPDGGLRRPDDRDESLDLFGARLLCAALLRGRLRHHASFILDVFGGPEDVPRSTARFSPRGRQREFAGRCMSGTSRMCIPTGAVMYCFLIGILMLGAGVSLFVPAERRRDPTGSPTVASTLREYRIPFPETR